MMVSFHEYTHSRRQEAFTPTDPTAARLAQLKVAMEAQRKKMLAAEARAEAEQKLFYQRQDEYRQAKRHAEMERPLKKFRQLPKSGYRLTVVSPTLYRLGQPSNPTIEIRHDPTHGWRWVGVSSYKNVNQYAGAWHRNKEDAIGELDHALARAGDLSRFAQALPTINLSSARRSGRR